MIAAFERNILLSVNLYGIIVSLIFSTQNERLNGMDRYQLGSISAALSCPVHVSPREKGEFVEERWVPYRTAADNRS